MAEGLARTSAPPGWNPMIAAQMLPEPCSRAAARNGTNPGHCSDRQGRRSGTAEDYPQMQVATGSRSISHGWRSGCTARAFLRAQSLSAVSCPGNDGSCASTRCQTPHFPSFPLIRLSSFVLLTPPLRLLSPLALSWSDHPAREGRLDLIASRCLGYRVGGPLAGSHRKTGPD